ncbi:MAG TPA: hypothetical protein VH479_25015 [Acidimicrobiales bacterium]|jgi:hypothetical protein
MPHVRVTARRRFMQFLILKPANVVIDGNPAGQVGWGTAKAAVFEVPPGRHRLTVNFPYLGGKPKGGADIDLDLADGVLVDVLYRTPFVVTMKGSLQITPTPVSA